MTDCLGLLLLTGETDDMTGDYLALVLRDGYIELRYDKRQANDEIPILYDYLDISYRGVAI